MSQITQITPQKRKGIFNIYLDGRFALGLDAESLVKEKLVEGQFLSEDELNRLKELSLYSKLLSASLNFLSFRPRSKNELFRNLKAKIYKLLGKGDPDLSGRLEDQIISKIEALGYLNDREFAKWWVGQRSESKNPHGPALIKKELFGKGVDRQIIETSLKQLKGAVSPEHLETMLAKKGKLLKNRPLQEQRRKLYDFLLRRGFDFASVRASVDKYLKKA